MVAAFHCLVVAAGSYYPWLVLVGNPPAWHDSLGCLGQCSVVTAAWVGIHAFGWFRLQQLLILI